MKRLTELWCALALELGEQLCVQVTRDLEKVARRVEHEGLSFLTITLPSFATDFESALEEGKIEPQHFRSFRKCHRIPAFLQGFVARVFDAKNGVLLDAPDAESVWAVRQLTLFFKKIEIDCTADRVDAAYDAYVACDEAMAEVNERVIACPEDFSEVRAAFAILYRPVLEKLERAIETYRLEPRHGPGATADRKTGNRKYVQDTWPERFESKNLFPYREYVLPRYGLDLPEPSFVMPENEIPVKVISVPKTLSAPRIIAEEPTCTMYMQQAIKDVLVPALEQDRLVGPMIGFTDQGPNRDLARLGSIDGLLATLDLSEASDRVSYQLVRSLVEPIAPLAWEALDATRSTRADVRGSVRQLNKFASMGSALCFPVEAMVFLAAVIAGLGVQRKHPLSYRDVLRLHGKVRVYGDDIIVPMDSAHSVIASLELLGLKVNGRKSFFRGKFRESCGGDYFDGEYVTPVRVRRTPPCDRTETESLESWVSTMNQLFERGLWKTSDMIRVWLEAILGPLPVIPRHVTALGMWSFLPSQGDRLCPKLHVPQVKAWVVKHPPRSCSVDGYWALRKCFTGVWQDPQYRDHLLYSGRPSVAKLQRRWVEADELLTSVSIVG